ncbi:MAG TPA: arginine repressor [Terriglobales bacterium]|jgi:transcriptional regulator of arginine metabolism|nr:arginine repressor [Terriglobales bacterium]
MSPATKFARQKLIVDVLQHGPAANQDELRKALAKHGLKVTQATLSRDIHKLGLVKTTEGYALSGNDHAPESGLPSAARLLREFVLEIREAQNLLVVKTSIGSAQPVAAALDAEGWEETVGTIAGDDTILIISPDKKSAHKLATRIREMIA